MDGGYDMDWYGTNNIEVKTGNPNSNPDSDPEEQPVERFDLIGLLWFLALIAIVKYIMERRR
jgi:hypothetical protein